MCSRRKLAALVVADTWTVIVTRQRARPTRKESTVALLADIIDGIDAMPVAALLRKTTVLAARLQTDPLAAWVRRELDGYTMDDDLPSYRGSFPAEVLGQFVLPYTSQSNTLPVPPVSLPETIRNGIAFQVEFRQPIAELESLATRPSVHSPWPADLVAYVNMLMRDGTAKLYECGDAQRQPPNEPTANARRSRRRPQPNT